MKDLYIAGISLDDLINKHNFSMKDLNLYLPINKKKINNEFEVHHLGYYLKWISQEAYYYSVENSNFKSRPYRSQGTYSKYSSIDDKIDDLHYYTTFIKYGLGDAHMMQVKKSEINI